MNKPATNVLYLAMRRSYWYGFFTYLGFNMFIQDYLGLEEFIAFVREHWVNVHWIVGLLICAGSLVFYIGLLTRFHWLTLTDEELKETQCN